MIEQHKGVYAFHFSSESDCKFVLDKRPWIINGFFLNILEWPVNGQWYESDFDKACF